MSKYQRSTCYEVKKQLFQSHTVAKKWLGQHFLIEPKILGEILSAAEITSADNVLEIGSGLGVITEHLVKYAGFVFAVEIDNKLARQLKRRFGNIKNIKIINDDILKLDPSQFLEGNRTYKVVANLPYNITSPVLNYFIEAPIKPRLMVIMVQKEVAEAIVAFPGKLSVLTISMQMFASARIIAKVPAEYFYPKPKVGSAILRIEFLQKPQVEVDNQKLFLETVRKGFRAPRKQLRNSLSLGMKLRAEDISSILHKANINIELRPEDLTLQDWQKIYQVMQQEGKL